MRSKIQFTTAARDLFLHGGDFISTRLDVSSQDQHNFSFVDLDAGESVVLVNGVDTSITEACTSLAQQYLKEDSAHHETRIQSLGLRYFSCVAPMATASRSWSDELLQAGLVIFEDIDSVAPRVGSWFCDLLLHRLFNFKATVLGTSLAPDDWATHHVFGDASLSEKAATLIDGSNAHVLFLSSAGYRRPVKDPNSENRTRLRLIRNYKRF